VASGAGMSAKDAGDFVAEVCKQAAAMRYDLDDDDEEQDTWWSRNKHWALPALLTSGAFILGNDVAKKGNPDWGIIDNSIKWTKDKLKALFGVVNDPMMDNFTDASRHGKYKTSPESYNRKPYERI